MEIHNIRLSKLRERMAAANIDLVALGPGPHMVWLLGFHPHADERPCLLLIGPKNEAFLMPELNAQGARVHTDIPFYNWSDADGPQHALVAALSATATQETTNVVIDETMRADFALLLLDQLPGANHTFTDTTVGQLRMCKDPQEYDCLQKNATIADQALSQGLAAIRVGMTERDIADVIRAGFTQQGAQLLFCIVGSGANGAYPHHQTGSDQLQRGDAVVIDCGGMLASYSSDITRMAVVGTPPPDYNEIHAIVESAVQAALAVAQPGVQAQEVDRAAREVIAAAGYGDYFVHRTGHGLGLEIHEPPYLTATSTTVLAEGMVFSIEPGIYLPDRFGLRLEEIVILRDNGPQVLSNLSRDVYVAPD